MKRDRPGQAVLIPSESRDLPPDEYERIRSAARAAAELAPLPSATDMARLRRVCGPWRESLISRQQEKRSLKAS